MDRFASKRKSSRRSGNYQGLARLNTDLVQHDATLLPTRHVTLDIAHPLPANAVLERAIEDLLVRPRAIQSWSLTSLQQRLLKAGGRPIRHARYFVLQLAESYLTQRLFAQIVGRVERLAWHPT